MSIEAFLTALINPLVANRIWWDTLPDGYVIAAGAPVVIAQQLTGDSSFHVDGTQPSHEHARIQFTVWAKTRKEANATARAIEEAIAGQVELGNTVAEPYSNFGGIHEPDLNLFGTQQPFGFWHPRP